MDEETLFIEDSLENNSGLAPFEVVHDTTDLPHSELVHDTAASVREESSTIPVEDISTSGSKWKQTRKALMQCKKDMSERASLLANNMENLCMSVKHKVGTSVFIIILRIRRSR
ncbi:hypothetical protein ACSBR2_012212 [Camellia fascicularis]